MVFSSREVVALCVFCLAVPLAFAQSKTLTLDEIVARLQQSQAQSREESVAYTVTRDYQLSPAGAQRPVSDVVAQINFVPPGAKDYSIVSSQGNDRGTSIVKKVLDHEAQMAGHPETHAISRSNYDFALLGHDTIDGHECYVLQLSPKRDAVELVRGKAWIDANDFEIRRIEGVTAKSPSMWIKDLTLTLTYGQVNGVWVQTSTQARADVRFAGAHVLTSRELDVRRASISAQAQPPVRVHQRRNGHNVGADAATWVAR